MTTELMDRQPPHDLESERALLGSMFVDPRTIDDIQLETQPDDFYDDSNRILYETMVSMVAQGVAIDPTTLVARLKQDSTFERVGGAAGLAKVIEAGGHASHFKFYASAVRSAATRRDVVDLSRDAIQAALDPSQDASDVAAVASDKMLKIGERVLAARPVGARELLGRALEEIDARRNSDRGGISTGLSDLDKIVGGFRPGELTIVGGRPSMGKSALLLNFAEAAAFAGESAMVASLEMSQIEYADRMLSSVAKVNSYSLRSGCISPEDRHKVIEAAAQLAETKLSIVDDPSLTVAYIANHARILKRRGGLGIVLVDYLQIIEPTDRKLPRQEQVAGIGRDLKRMARALEVPVVVACQLNKESGNNPPELHHLRESDALSHEADVVMFVHRPEYYFPSDPEHKGIGYVLVRKQRMGPTGEVKAVWRKEYTRFDSLAASDLPNYNPTLAAYGSGDF